MPILILSDARRDTAFVPQELLFGKRHLTEEEIAVLQKNHNYSSDASWRNVYVSSGAGAFSPELIKESSFSGFVVIGRLRPAMLQYHDLKLSAGIFRSALHDVSVGDDCVINNVAYLSNYRLAERVMLFNIQEMSCTKHSKFGEGILKEGEPERNRVWIGVGNENDGRRILPFASMIPADAWLWATFREDSALMRRFLELTEHGNDRRQNTFGIVEHDAVIKNTTLLKDARIGSYAYIKGAFKLKNITVLSSADEVSQIGEGVELVNGIVGFGSRIFYQAVAVRFVIGRNCQLKYGARLLNSVLGDNSTVSCCEILNNLIFPFHEQHHNSSFLIAAQVGGQSNIASGATIGSNHNSRSPDGEIVAGRGFWPGLCTDFKHNSYFASFVLAAKGSYNNELNIRYPFSLVAPCTEDQTVHVIPAYWFLYNMFAIARNNSKFNKRDKRAVKVQHIETSPFAPDTMQEILQAVLRLIELTGRYLRGADDSARREFAASNTKDALRSFVSYSAQARLLADDELLQLAKDFLHRNKTAVFVLRDDRCQKKRGARIYKPAQGYKEYRKVIKYSAVSFLLDWCALHGCDTLTAGTIAEIRQIPLYTQWCNAGGQIVPQRKIEELLDGIKSRRINTWQDVHAFYDECWQDYAEWKAAYGVYLLEWLYSRQILRFNAETYRNILEDVEEVSNFMYQASVSSRQKDFTDYFRTITYRNKDEMTAVIGTIDDNDFLRELGERTAAFNGNLKQVFSDLCR